MAKQKRSRRKQRQPKPARKETSSTWLYLLLGGAGLLVVALVLVAIANRPATPAPAPVATVASTSSENIPYPEVPRIPLAEAKAKVDSGEAVFVDVRTAAEYANSHPKGAISIPLSELADRYQELPRDKEIITICA
jgi:hypothetical protein